MAAALLYAAALLAGRAGALLVDWQGLLSGNCTWSESLNSVAEYQHAAEGAGRHVAQDGNGNGVLWRGNGSLAVVDVHCGSLAFLRSAVAAAALEGCGGRPPFVMTVQLPGPAAAIDIAVPCPRGPQLLSTRQTHKAAVFEFDRAVRAGACAMGTARSPGVGDVVLSTCGAAPAVLFDGTSVVVDLRVLQYGPGTVVLRHVMDAEGIKAAEAEVAVWGVRWHRDCVDTLLGCEALLTGQASGALCCSVNGIVSIVDTGSGSFVASGCSIGDFAPFAVELLAGVAVDCSSRGGDWLCEPAEGTETSSTTQTGRADAGNGSPVQEPPWGHAGSSGPPVASTLTSTIAAAGARTFTTTAQGTEGLAVQGTEGLAESLSWMTTSSKATTAVHVGTASSTASASTVSTTSTVSLALETESTTSSSAPLGSSLAEGSSATEIPSTATATASASAPLGFSLRGSIATSTSPVDVQEPVLFQATLGNVDYSALGASPAIQSAVVEEVEAFIVQSANKQLPWPGISRADVSAALQQVRRLQGQPGPGTVGGTVVTAAVATAAVPMSSLSEALDAVTGSPQALQARLMGVDDIDKVLRGDLTVGLQVLSSSAVPVPPPAVWLARSAECSTRCGTGQISRVFQCTGEEEAECGERPPEIVPCSEHDGCRWELSCPLGPGTMRCGVQLALSASALALLLLACSCGALWLRRRRGGKARQALPACNNCLPSKAAASPAFMASWAGSGPPVPAADEDEDDLLLGAPCQRLASSYVPPRRRPFWMRPSVGTWLRPLPRAKPCLDMELEEQESPAGPLSSQWQSEECWLLYF